MDRSPCVQEPIGGFIAIHGAWSVESFYKVRRGIMLGPIIALPTPINIVAVQAANLAPWWSATLSGLGTTLSVTGGLVVGAIPAATFGTRRATPTLRWATTSNERCSWRCQTLKRLLKTLKALSFGHKIWEAVERSLCHLDSRKTGEIGS